MESLDQLAIKYKTDKSSEWHNYTKFYSQILNPFRNEIKGIVELGIGKPDKENKDTWGASLKMWRDFFPNAQVLGIDNNTDLNINYGERINVLISDQTDQRKLSQIPTIMPQIDIIVDDASHLNKLTISSFELLFPILNPGGIYFIEDTLCSDNIHFGNYRGQIEDFIVFLMRCIETNSRQVSKRQVADFNKIGGYYFLNYFEKNVERVDIYRGVYAIYKRS